MNVYSLVTFLIFNFFLIVKSQNYLKEEIKSFTFRYLDQIKEIEKSNIVFSPFGIYRILPLLSFVADDTTKKSILSFLNIEDIKFASFNFLCIDIHNDIKSYYEKNKTSKIILNLLFLFNQTLTPDKKFYKYADEVFHADISKKNILKESKTIRNKINYYLSIISNNSISNVIDIIGKHDLIDIFNANYFEDHFRTPFNSSSNFTFNSLNKEPENIFMNENKQYYYYIEKKNYQMLELEYKSGAFMYFILPKKGVEINQLINELSKSNNTELFWNLRKKYVDIKIPSVKVKITHDLYKFLPLKGKNLIPNNNFNSIINGEWITINKIKQYNYIDFGDDYYPGITYKNLFDIPPIEFKMDRPFIFLLKISGIIVMAGVIKDI